MQVAKTILGNLWIFLLVPIKVKGLECTKPITTENAVIHEDNILTEVFPEKATIKLKCHPGYEPTSTSPRRLTCENGQWNPQSEKFTCQKKTCSNPGDIENGSYKYLKGNEFGDTITAVCNTGYYILGHETRVCMANGEWDGQPPVCEAVKCGRPPHVPNGHLLLHPEDEYDYGQAVQYVCDHGYTLFEGTVHCLQNGSWSSTPQCIVVDCKRPDIPNARRIEGGSGPYGHRDTLRYECYIGYRMANDIDRTVCLEMGWSPALLCEEVKCSQLKFTNASMTDWGVGPYRHGSVIKYQCQTGYTLFGSSRLECGPDGQWSSDPPVCQEVICPQLSTNATITKGGFGPYRHGSVIKYQCQTGHTLFGSSQLECGPDGQWSSNTPVCQVVTCPHPGKTNAIITGAGGSYAFNDVLEYVCSSGETLIGSHKLKCQSDGHWSSNPPSCKGGLRPHWIILIGILIFTILILCAVWFFFFWKKKNSRKTDCAVKGEHIKLNSNSDPECVVQSSGTNTQTT